MPRSVQNTYNTCISARDCLSLSPFLWKVEVLGRHNNLPAWRDDGLEVALDAFS